jgi:hypothetical protein
MIMNEKYDGHSKMLEDIIASTQTRYQDRDPQKALSDIRMKLQSIENRQQNFEKIVTEHVKDLKNRLDLLTEAIAVSHMKDDADKCIRGCWACHIIDVMRGLKAARKLMDEVG